MNMVLKTITRSADKFLLFRLYKYYIIDSIIIVKREGFKSLIKKRGWKFLLIIAGYYAVRDTIIYILIPLIIAKGLI
ncbi:MAG: hypothetical protein EHM47_18675 [Ignavibacteriales bacterium]|nr:MAG: hypothetical protein EHM47_18675 [Ignavibacteriales bacterium]